ncbi:glycosyltransferase family 2 protein [Streptomyces sp. NPDC059104]|uniref:glycosyltransferase family 2 protein n=1 Tax=Streptomyces sp. NPDC059104 TaxID=3346729 RepID=UPI0036C5072F
MPRVSVVVLNWNGLADTLACVDSVLENDHKDLHVVLIDNASDGDEWSRLQSEFESEVRVTVIRNEENLGFAGGCNTGIRFSLESGADYILILNNDTLVDRDFLSKLLRSAEVNAADIVGPRIVRDDDLQSVWWVPSQINYYYPALSRELSADVSQEVNNLVGCCMLVSKRVFESVGLFDEYYFIYGEESDFNLRAVRSGFKLFYCAESMIRHKVSKSWGVEFHPNIGYYKMRNRIYLARKNFSARHMSIHWVYLVHYFVLRVGGALRRGNVEYAKAVVQGVRDAFRKGSGGRRAALGSSGGTG